MATFSVIIPVHNGEKTIRRCVESLISQADEILLIENGSKDNSKKLCASLSDEYSNVISIDGANIRGVSQARNAGLAAVTMDYILFCDCDDFVEANYVDSFRCALNSADFAICGYINHDEIANGRTDIYGFAEKSTVNILPLLENIHGQCLLQQLWNKVFCADIIKKYGIRFDESISIGEDMRFVLDYLGIARPSKTELIARPLYHYMRDQPGSLMYRMGTERLEEAITNLTSLYRLMGMPENEIKDKMNLERENQKSLYAYLIMHNMGMPLLERRKLILKLDKIQGKALWRRNFILFIKEKISKTFKK